ncbi:MAG TPA: DoxX family protein [Bacteroidales bacterium]|nr:DoxX family protein [Bacteroidales bacterium]
MKKFLLMTFIPASPDLGLLILRVWAGLSLFRLHGIEKIVNFSGMLQHFPDPIHVGALPGLLFATLADAICSLLVIIGLMTRLASLIIVINLAIVFIFLHNFSFMQEHGQLVYLYLGIFLSLVAAGAGRISIDNLIK